VILIKLSKSCLRKYYSDTIILIKQCCTVCIAMRIGVNCIPLQKNNGGLRQYFQRLFNELLDSDASNSYLFFYDDRNESELDLLLIHDWRNSSVKVVDEGEIVLHLMMIDLLFCPFGVLWPRPLQIPSVVQLADIQEVFYPQFFTEDILRCRKLNYPASTRSADAVITLSEFSKRTIAEQHLIELEKIFVTTLVVDEALQNQSVADLSRLGLPERFVFYPANHWQHKNHDSLLIALNLLKDELGVEIPCIFTGLSMENGYPLAEKVAFYGLSAQVRDLGYLSQSEVQSVYYKATLLCFPSLFEGFGIPVLEAMAAGCPVVCAESASLPEVAGDAAIYFNPSKPEEIAAAIARLWDDNMLRAELVERGRSQAEKFTTVRMATVHQEAFAFALKSFLPEIRTVYKNYLYDSRGFTVSSAKTFAAEQAKQLAVFYSLKITRLLQLISDRICRCLK